MPQKKDKTSAKTSVKKTSEATSVNKKETQNVEVETEKPVKMNSTLKKIILYFSILGAITVTVLGIGHIWGNIATDVIGRTIATYFVLFISIALIPTVPELYRSIKYYPELASVGVWLLSITIAVICLVVCVAIRKTDLDSNLVWRTIATMLMINFGMIVAVFAMDKWGSRSPE